MDDQTRQFRSRGERAGGTDGADDTTRYIPRGGEPAEGATRYDGSAAYPETRYGEDYVAPRADYQAPNQTQYLGAQQGSYESDYVDDYGYDDRYRDPAYQRRGYQEPYEEPYTPPQSGKRGTSTTAIVMTTLAVVLGLAAMVLFFLWRGAEGRANNPEPPVTYTQTETVTTSAPGLLDEIFRRDPERDGNREDNRENPIPEITIPSELPEAPTEIPPELQEDADNIARQIESFFNDLFGSR